MGLSASQARLLSITARLTDNEYHSQQIANAKTRLAAKGTEAREEYQRALNSSVLIYNGFDTQGNATSTILTPNVIYQYQPLKNQYALINTAGNILVSHEDAKNYEETDTIIDFLDRYDVLDDYEGGSYKAYQNRYKQYLDDHAAWVEKAAQWRIDKAKYDDYKIAHDKWVADNQNNTDLYQLFKDEVGTSQLDTDAGGHYCYYHALRGRPDCFLHLLNHLLDYDGTLKAHTYTASCDTNGEKTSAATFTTGTDGGGMHSGVDNEVMKTVSEGISRKKGGKYEKLCDGDDKYIPDYNNGGVEDEDKYNLLKAAIADHGTPTALEILSSDYIYDPATGTADKIKSLHQKTVDMYYMIQNRTELGITEEQMKEFLINFTEGDLKKVADPEPEFVPDPGELEPEPTPPPVPEIKIKDREKAQWYTNLWCRMNGMNESPKIQTEDGYDKMDEWYRKFILEPKSAVKNTFAKNYEEIDMHLATSSTWLEDVLSQGIVVMQRVANDNIDSDVNYNWKEIIYTDASELTIETDDKAIAKAEVVYEDKMRQIEAKDKRYQLEINKLDSEHNALQTQIDSIKGEVAKNIERSYKTFG